MSQRIRRAKDRKNDIDSSTMATGGHVVHHSRETNPVVRVPQKTTGEVPGEKLAGLAKASPFFKPIAEIKPSSKAEEQKAIAEAVQPIEPETEDEEAE